MATPTLRFTPSSVLRAAVMIGVSILVAGVAVRAAHPIMWFLQASVIAALAWPVIGRLKRHMPSWVAILGLTIAVAVVVGILGAVGFSELQNESKRFETSVPAAARRLQDTAPLGGVLKELKLARQTDRIAADVAQRFRLSGRDLPGLATRVGGGASATFVVWVLAVMIVFAGPGMVDAGVSWLRPSRRAPAHAMLRLAYAETLRYLGLTAVRSIVVGVVTYAIAVGLGIDLPALLATLAALLALIPYVGIGLASLPVALLAVLNSPTQSVLILVVGVTAQTVDALVVQPRIDRAAFRFGLFPTLVVTVIGFSLYGPSGLFIGLTIGCVGMAMVQTIGVDQTFDERSNRAASSSNAEPGVDPEAMTSSTASNSTSTSDT